MRRPSPGRRSACRGGMRRVGAAPLIAVEESGLLVGLALVHDRATQFGRHEFRHFADEIGAYCQLLVADAREDVTTLLWECLLDPGWGIDLGAVPTTWPSATR